MRGMSYQREDPTPSCQAQAKSPVSTHLAVLECVGSLYDAGYTVPPYYDSMIGKLICYGEQP